MSAEMEAAPVRRATAKNRRAAAPGAGSGRDHPPWLGKRCGVLTWRTCEPAQRADRQPECRKVPRLSIISTLGRSLSALIFSAPN